LIGAVDWYTKKYLLDQAGDDCSWAERKKIDIRYHELSPEGYFSRLRHAGLVADVVDERFIERATRTPPSNSPATMRGHYIREFGGGAERMLANWKAITLGYGWKRRVVRLSQYASASPANRRPTNHTRGRNRRPRT
jgi:proteasome accessory factor A